jgi:hypothetical protein
MRRRDFIAGLGSAAAWPLPARAQQPTMPVIGWLDEVPGTMRSYLPLFNQGLAETGYVVGRNVTIESREGDRGRLRALAADLVRQHVTVIAVMGVARRCARAVAAPGRLIAVKRPRNISPSPSVTCRACNGPVAIQLSMQHEQPQRFPPTGAVVDAPCGQPHRPL